MGEVAAFGNVIRPATQSGMSEPVKELLDQITPDVLSGEIQGLAIVTVHRDETTSYDMAGIIACRGSIGALEEMKLDMILSHTGREEG